jgi:hypothetical protein
MKAKLSSYNLAKGSLTQMQRKKTYVTIRLVATRNLSLLLQRKSLGEISHRYCKARTCYSRIGVHGDRVCCRTKVSSEYNQLDCPLVAYGLATEMR